MNTGTYRVRLTKPSFAVLLLLTLLSYPGTAAVAQEAPRDAVAPGGELIRNGGFEEPLVSGNDAPSWTDNSAWAPVQVRYSDETTRHRSGRHARRIECTSFKGGAVQFVQYGVPLEKGAVYRISLWMRGKVDSPVEILLRKGPAPYTTYMSRLFTPGEAWAEYAFEAVCDESDPAAMFIIRFGATGTLVVDDVSCRKVRAGGGVLELKPPVAPIPPTYFGHHLHRNSDKTAWPAVPFGALRLWDAHVSWPHLEPERGKWQWKRLDTYLALAEEHSAEVLLPLGLTPTWASARPEEKSAYNGAGVSRQTGWAAEPRDFQDWDNYVRAVATHCKGRVYQYEIWNEPNMVPFFSGTVDHLVELTRRAAVILKEVDPKNRVVSPSIVGDSAYLDNFWRKYLQSGAAATEVVGFHFYVWPEPPEKMVPQILRAREVLAERKLGDRPLWNTEAGWNIQSLVSPPAPSKFENGPPLPMETASAYIARAYILNWAAGVERYYYYSWDNDLMGLVEKDGTLKPPAHAYAAVHRWLAGARMESCTRDAAGTWTARLSRDGGRPAVIVWNADKELKLTPPAEWGVTQVSTLTGEVRPIAAGEAVSINGTPILLD